MLYLCYFELRNATFVIPAKAGMADGVIMAFRNSWYVRKRFMRILITTGIFPPEIGGPATYSNLLLHELTARGFLVKILTYSNTAHRSPIFSVSKKWPKGLRHFMFFLKLFYLAWSSDLILSADASFGAGFFSAIVSKILHKKFIVRVTGDYAWEQGVARFGVKDLLDDFWPLKFSKKYSFAVWVIAKLQAWTVGFADVVIAPSEYLKKIALRWGLNENKIRVIYNGIILPEVLESREELRKKFGFNGLAVLSAGRLVKWKGFSVLIEAFNEVARDFPGVELIIIGDGPERGALEFLISNFSPSGRSRVARQFSIKILNKMPQVELFKYIKAVDIFALNTAYEGFSHQLVEVMGLGVSIITTDVGGNPEIIIDGENGVLLPYNDKAKLRDGLFVLLRDKDLRNKLAGAGFETAKKFTDEIMINKLVEVVNKI